MHKCSLKVSKKNKKKNWLIHGWNQRLLMGLLHNANLIVDSSKDIYCILSISALEIQGKYQGKNKPDPVSILMESPDGSKYLESISR
jgi:hypothetical protein